MDNGDIRARYTRLIDVELHTADGVRVQVVEVTKPQFSGEFQSFSVYISGPLDSPLEQGMVELREADGSTDPLFLVPISHDHTGYLYEACFNVRANVAAT